MARPSALRRRSGRSSTAARPTVYTHPTSANCCANLLPGISDAAIEFGTDTTRAIASLIFSGTSQKYKDINWIWSHGGGALTAFAERFHGSDREHAAASGQVHAPNRSMASSSASTTTPRRSRTTATLEALTKLVPISQIVYGTDFPYRTAADHTKGVTPILQG